MTTNDKGWSPLRDRLAALSCSLFRRDFLATWDFSIKELEAVLTAAEALEWMYSRNIAARVFESGLAVSQFRDQSTRTRFSFAKAANLLGLAVQELDEGKSQIAHGETVRETANMVSFMAEAIGIRDDVFLGEGHAYMAEVATAVDEGHREGVLGQRPAVINLQSDLDHPTQSMADLLHLKNHFGSLEAMRGKRIAMTWAYSPSYGKPLSVPQGVITLMTRFGMHVTLAHPKGYELVPETLDRSAAFARECGGSFAQTFDMAGAFANADVVYPKSWAPFDVMVERTRLLKSRDTGKLADLEKACLARNKEHRDWHCNDALMAKTARGSALYMHCLPADISGVSTEHGEVSAGVFEKYRIATYREAGHKPFVIAAMLLLTRFRDATVVLDRLITRPTPRRAE